jgi:hypothetical protein
MWINATDALELFSICIIIIAIWTGFFLLLLAASLLFNRLLRRSLKKHLVKVREMTGILIKRIYEAVIVLCIVQFFISYPIIILFYFAISLLLLRLIQASLLFGLGFIVLGISLVMAVKSLIALFTKERWNNGIWLYREDFPGKTGAFHLAPKPPNVGESRWGSRTRRIRVGLCECLCGFCRKDFLRWP